MSSLPAREQRSTVKTMGKKLNKKCEKGWDFVFVTFKSHYKLITKRVLKLVGRSLLRWETSRAIGRHPIIQIEGKEEECEPTEKKYQTRFSQFSKSVFQYSLHPFTNENALKKTSDEFKFLNGRTKAIENQS